MKQPASFKSIIIKVEVCDESVASCASNSLFIVVL